MLERYNAVERVGRMNAVFLCVCRRYSSLHLVGPGGLPLAHNGHREANNMTQNTILSITNSKANIIKMII